MHYVSLLAEFLRGRPAVVFWTAALTQAALWTLIPAFFYSAPPGDVPLLLAIGREFVLGSYLGPPLAFWLGEIAFGIAGSFGLYALAQGCIVVTYWAVFALGRGIVGIRHAILAVLLMVGIAAFTVPSPNFGPAILAAPLWALALLHYWRVVGEGRRGYWVLLAVDLGLLLLTSYVGFILLALIIGFTLSFERARQAAFHPEPGIAAILLCIVIFPHAVWLWKGASLVVEGINEGAASTGRLSAVAWLLLALVLVHLGLALLVALTSGWPRHPRERAPEIDRNPVEPFARTFIFFFALAPASVAIVIALVTGRLGPLDRVAPLVVLSGLAVIVAAGDKVLLYRERLVSSAWLGLLVAPPVLVALSIAIVPWTFGNDMGIAQPANAEGRYYADIYQRRTGRPLFYLAGDPRIAPLVALGAPSRPHVYFAWAPHRSPWVSPADFRTKGGILVWPAADNSGTPPETLKVQFPEMVPEVPRSFPRAVQGRLPLIRIGWSVQRPPTQ
ncbi:MAG TPA: glycosyltransferase family 39 protein [Pseudolabrys sp.]|jgi:4-amino-4-deoxy-L-arabinose transferase-like glycosyltransferase